MKTIKSKILLTYVGVTILALVLSWFFTSIRISDYLEGLTKERIKGATRQIVNYLVSDSIDNYNNLYNKIKIISALNDTRITLIDSVGKVWCDSDIDIEKIDTVENHKNREEIINARNNHYGFSKRFSHTVHKWMIYYAEYYENPLHIGDKKIYYIRTSIPIITINRLGTEIKFILGISAILSLIIIFVTSLQISEWMTKPLKNLKDFALDLKNGFYKRRFHVDKKDEIGILAETLNQLAESIENEKSEVERLESIKKEFITNLMHELRTPLFVIESSLETLQNMNFADIEKVKEFVGKASNQTKRLHKVVDNLILISKLRTGEQVVNLRSLKATDFIKKIYDDYKEIIESKNIEFVLSINAPDDIKILGDKQLLSYALDNLLDNSIKYTQEKGKIELSLSADNGHVVFIVSDTGKGISQNELKKITEYFYRPELDHNSKTGGAGLGLAVVKEIIRMHNGALIMESELSKGSKFGFKLSISK
ncbi:MAG TPA: ATP-binding protein [Bacteroidota bacterium]|mgnify:CR=1 FL=1|nr:ATP-binding protein [Bacteroidota bacterium]